MRALKSKWQVRRTSDGMVLSQWSTRREAKADQETRQGPRGGSFHVYVSRVAKMLPDGTYARVPNVRRGKA